MIVVVGGRGLIGGGIVDALREKGRAFEIVTHDRQQALKPGFRYGDMREPATLPRALAGADIVIQSAMFPSYPIEKPRKGQTYMAYDGEGTENLVRAARAVGVRRYIFVGGAGCELNPLRPYFHAIRRGEQAVLGSGMEAVVIAPTLVFGPRDRGLNVVARAARWLPLIPVIDGGRALEQPVAVWDVGCIAEQAARLRAPQGKFEIGGPDRLTLKQTIERVLAAIGLRRAIVPVPVALARFGASLLQRLPGTPLTVNAVDFLTESFIADNTRVLAAFHIALTPFEDGIRRYLGPGKVPQ